MQFLFSTFSIVLCRRLAYACVKQCFYCICRQLVSALNISATCMDCVSQAAGQKLSDQSSKQSQLVTSEEQSAGMVDLQPYDQFLLLVVLLLVWC